MEAALCPPLAGPKTCSHEYCFDKNPAQNQTPPETAHWAGAAPWVLERLLDPGPVSSGQRALLKLPPPQGAAGLLPVVTGHLTRADQGLGFAGQ